MMTPKFSLSLIAGVIASALPYSTFAADQSVANQSIENQSAVNKVSNTVFDPVVLTPSQTDFGGVGLMQMPSGRMAPEGEFNIGASINNEYHHYNVSLQVMPWLETTIRYTLVQDLLYSGDESFSGKTKYTDKGIDFKIRLLKESKWLPETSVGVRDFGGTGLFDGEFVAATKRFGNLDVTLGMGWGYLGQSGNVTNPFCKASDKFCSRQSDYKGKGGSVDFERWFKGPAAIYGGIEYQTPYQPLRLKVEYDSNDYSQDFPVTRGNVDMTQHTPWNFGVLYGLGDWGDIKVSYQRGDTLTLGVNLSTNFNDMKAIWRDEPITAYNESNNQSIDEVDWQRVNQQLNGNAGYEDNRIYADNDSITLVATQTKYRDSDEAHDRASRIFANHVPETISTYRIIETNQSIPVSETVIDATQYKKVANNEYFDAKVADASQTDEVTYSPSEQTLKSDNLERWDYSVSPTLSQSIGSAESFYLYAVGINTAGSVWLTDKVQASGSLYFNLFDNYDKFNYITPPDGTSVPRVRTMFRAYVHENPVRMNNLQLTWFEEYGAGFYSQMYAGYLESMFGGIGSEVMYRPLNSNWAFGVDATYIKQRTPGDWFGFYEQDHQEGGDYGRDYTVVSSGVTGFATAYYAPQWSFLKNTLLKVGVGQFLAGDKGTRIDFSKQFDSGVIAGAYASFTNLSAEEFGEGSYTKGFYLSIPFDIMTVKPSKNRANFNWQPLTRDGGQMLNKQHELYELTDERSPWFTRKGL
ncbi:YjbH domain-containing protein [Aliivibrio fischeri]|uniref:YjbH domain-containing protein n=1 Tax=Aliivibrio fischeri TaxID=668 RepID=UPI0012D900B8|nr:YjbH domain-containing protein [Aliivibrio fischeri]MUK77070.1 YjbH domain-containing protein [Aliivibrio fischeri]